MMMANPSVMVPSTIYEATTLGRIVAQHDACGAGADGRSSQRIVQFLDAQHLRPYDPDRARQQNYHQRYDDVVGRPAHGCDQRQRQYDGGNAIMASTIRWIARSTMPPA